MSSNIHVLLCYKNFATACNVSHIGLGVTAAYTSKTLNSLGYFAQAQPIFGADDLTTILKTKETSKTPVTHVVLMAQFIDLNSLATLVRNFLTIKFAMNCHSNVGFLQAEPPAINIIRGCLDLELEVPNFHTSANNKKLCKALLSMYEMPAIFLPNLYYLTGKELINRPLWNGGLLKIGIFGSLRIYKNISTAIAAAVDLTTTLKCSSEIWINSGRDDGAGDLVYKTAVAWTKGLPHITLKELSWTSWADFKKVISSMNILMQPSFTETFNNVTADGVASGVPSAVSTAIEWVPNYWRADADDVGEVARVARQLLFDPKAPLDGYNALKEYVQLGIPYWKNFLETWNDPIII